jgi:hypothetical protein
MDTPKSEKKTYSMEEIRKLAPGYRGKPENFDPRKIGRKAKPKTKSPNGPRSPLLTPPSALARNTNPTEQCNNLILEESIFGVDVTIIPIQPREDFSSNFSQLTNIAMEAYNLSSTDERQIDRVLAKEELSYYATGMLWLRLLDVKAKQGREALTSEEKTIRKATEEVEFNIPQPISMYLSQVGQYTDKTGKTTDIEISDLPVARAGGMGGYHASEITEAMHNLFKEVPSLGIAADMVMNLCQEAPEPTPNFRVGNLEGTRVTENLLGRIYPVGPRRPEIKQ